MKQYRPRRRRTTRGYRFNKNMLALICAAVAVVVVVIIIINVNNKGEKQFDPTDVFASNVTIQGISVGGMTADEAQVALSPVTKELMGKAVVEINVPAIDKGEDVSKAGEDEAAASDENADESESSGDEETASAQTEDKASAAASADGAQTVEYTASEAGIKLDVDGTLQQAMEYSQGEGKFKKDDAPVMDFSILYVVDETVLKAKLDEDAAAWSKPAQNASYTLKTTNSEDGLTTSAEPVKKEGTPGEEVDVNALVASIKQMVSTQSFGTIDAPVVQTQPKITADQLGDIEVIGTYSTSYSNSPLNRTERMYNIWKISSILNGVRIPAGEEISVNDIVGPRTEEGGWALAPGIENGAYKDQAGGGICQVSTTLYIAAMKAELKITERTHHTYPSSYVPLGLDATISTDSPDLKLENNTESPVLIGINCDVEDRTVEVNIYGVNPRDYTLRFESKTIQTIPPTADTYVADPAVAVNTTSQQMAAHTGYEVEVYKVWYDKDGKEYDRKRIYTDTYKPSGAIIAYNPSTPPAAVTAAAGASAPVTDPAAAATPAPTPTPTPSVAPTTAPSTEPTPTPSASTAPSA